MRHASNRSYALDPPISSIAARSCHRLNQYSSLRPGNLRMVVVAEVVVEMKEELVAEEELAEMVETWFEQEKVAEVGSARQRRQIKARPRG
jgi:meiotically up-regulated gene 157 (Mug157) protein